MTARLSIILLSIYALTCIILDAAGLVWYCRSLLNEAFYFIVSLLLAYWYCKEPRNKIFNPTKYRYLFYTLISANLSYSVLNIVDAANEASIRLTFPFQHFNDMEFGQCEKIVYDFVLYTPLTWCIWFTCLTPLFAGMLCWGTRKMAELNQ